MNGGMRSLCERKKMPIWKPTPKTLEPETVLANWKVFLVPDSGNSEGDTIHFVGSTLAWYSEGRVSSAIQEFDPETGCGISRSGRVYTLAGESTHLSRDAEYVWNRWLYGYGNPEVEDISEQFE